MKKVCAMIPCHNEAKAIRDVLRSIPFERLKFLGYEVEVLVVDNGSTDGTGRVAELDGARVVFEGKLGKGNAIRTGFRSIPRDVDFVVMFDGDGTYLPSEMPRLLELLDSDFSDVVVGSRLEGNIVGKSMSFSHRAANWFFTFITRLFYKANVTDTCSGYFAWKRKVIDVLEKVIESDGFAVEAEMISKLARMGCRVYSVPITYRKRFGDSKLAPVRDGIRITWMLIKNKWWKPKNENCLGV